MERLGDGASVDDLVNNYVGLTPEHVRAATAYAAAVLRRDELAYSDLDCFSGCMGPDPDLERALTDQRRIDPELWP